MKLGIISHDFEKATFEKIKSRGLDFVEFCINYCENDLHDEFYSKAKEIKQSLDALSLFTGSVGRWGANKINEDGSINEAELAVDRQLIDAANQLGCSVYVTNCNYIDGISLFDNYKAAISYFEMLLEYGKQRGVKIATNNCRWNNYLTCDPAWSVVHGHLKELYIKFDPSHCIYDGGDYLAEMKKWGGRFAHIHIKGSLVANGERVDDPPAGLDQTNWGAFMASLYASGYDGTLSIEPHSGIWTGELGEKGIAYTIEYMRKLML